MGLGLVCSTRILNDFSENMSLGNEIRVDRVLNIAQAILSTNTSVNAAIFNAVDGGRGANFVLK